MRAIVVRPPSPGATLEDVPAPPLAAGAVRVRVIECGVCGTDHDIVDGKYGRPPAGAPYLVLGHENFGEVLEVAPGAVGFSPGDLVVATVRRGCGSCRFCAVNRSDFCETGRFTERGIGGAHGYMAEEYVDVPEYLVRVPPPLAASAVLLEPLSVVEKAIEQGLQVFDRKEPTPGQPRDRAPTALVAGTGAIGMLASLVLTLRGCSVTTIDRHGESTAAAALLRTAGARHVNAAAGLGVLGDSRFDLVLEATGSATLDFSLLERLGPNGVLVLTGIPDAAQPPTSVPGGALLREMVLGNRAIVGSVNANRKHFEAGLRDLLTLRERHAGLCESLVSERRPLAEFHAALDHRAGSSIKTVLTVGAPAQT
ncbi:MAG: glucose 1-dehydrogenase [Thermoplasmata archaeon]